MPKRASSFMVPFSLQTSSTPRVTNCHIVTRIILIVKPQIGRNQGFLIFGKLHIQQRPAPWYREIPSREEVDRAAAPFMGALVATELVGRQDLLEQICLYRQRSPQHLALVLNLRQIWNASEVVEVTKMASISYPCCNMQHGAFLQIFAAWKHNIATDMALCMFAYKGKYQAKPKLSVLAALVAF